MTGVERRDLGDGQEPAYVFRSPCCDSAEIVTAWMVGYVQRHLAGRLWLRCGRTATDALRVAGSVGRQGCGEPFAVHCGPAEAGGGQPS